MKLRPGLCQTCHMTSHFATRTEGIERSQTKWLNCGNTSNSVTIPKRQSSRNLFAQERSVL